MKLPNDFIVALEVGASIQHAAAIARISPDELKKWLADDEIAKTIRQHAAVPRLTFTKMLTDAAVVASEKGDVRSIVQAMQTLFPADYPNVKQIEVKEIKDNFMGLDLTISKEKEISIASMTTAELFALAEKLK